mmetsp:Transcript_8348/g.34143  ORF Transcript_8348/g.34143 Transcript_8348/m.34143 type:complete len:278 (+) Transcript_8348:40-873(+)
MASSRLPARAQLSRFLVPIFTVGPPGRTRLFVSSIYRTAESGVERDLEATRVGHVHPAQRTRVHVLVVQVPPHHVHPATLLAVHAQHVPAPGQQVQLVLVPRVVHVPLHHHGVIASGDRSRALLPDVKFRFPVLHPPGQIHDAQRRLDATRRDPRRRNILAPLEDPGFDLLTPRGVTARAVDATAAGIDHVHHVLRGHGVPDVHGRVIHLCASNRVFPPPADPVPPPRASRLELPRELDELVLGHPPVQPRGSHEPNLPQRLEVGFRQSKRVQGVDV